MERAPSRQHVDISNYQTDEARAAEARLGKFIYDEAPINFESNLISCLPVEVDDGTIYFGQWSPEGYPHGKGVQFLKDGTKFEGYWVNGKQVGKGRMINPKGEVFEGSFLNGQFHGYGKYSGNYEYSGEWKNNLMDGDGKLVNADGLFYEGSFLLGQKHGIGKEGKLNDSGFFFVGDFLKDNKQGKGVGFSDNRVCYEGEITSAQESVLAIQIWEDGTNYFGELFNFCRNGRGEISHSDGVIERGTWDFDILHGVGLIKPVIGQFVKVEWEDGDVCRVIEND